MFTIAAVFSAATLVLAQAPPAAPGVRRRLVVRAQPVEGVAAGAAAQIARPRVPRRVSLRTRISAPPPASRISAENSQSVNAKMRGIWQVPYIVDMQKQGKALDGGPVVVPFTPLGQKFFDAATATNSKDDPEGFCLPPGVPRMMYTPYPAEIFQLPNRIVFVFEGAAHVWRNIWLDGREQPKDPNPDYLGYSTGKWEGDTLVVDTVGFNDPDRLDAAGHGHGEKLHVTERFTRTDSNTLKIEATIEDPDYYTKPWTTVTQATWMPNAEILEYICQENNRDLKHLVGK